MFWRLILPTIGLLLFTRETYSSYRYWQIQSQPGRYFWWASIRLDSDPLNRYSPPRVRNNAEWDLHEIAEPGWMEISSVLSGLPAFLVSKLIVAGLSRLGVSQIFSFMISTPILLFVWYYFLGWLLDRRRRKRRVVNI